MAFLVLETDDTMTIITSLVTEEVIVEQTLLPHLAAPIAVESHGEVIQQEQARPDWWVAGEDAVLRRFGVGSVEAKKVYARARSWFGARLLGAAAVDRFPSGVQRLRLVPPGTYGPDVHGVEL